MSVDDITPEETGKLAGILEAKFNRLNSNLNKVTEELDAARLTNDILQKDVDYWHDRALKAEARGDKFWADADFMVKKWDEVFTKAGEVQRMIKKGVLGEAEPAGEPPPDEKIPSILVFNRPPLNTTQQ